jgi:hypothetical protein
LTRKYLPPLLATGWFAYPEPTFHRWPLALLKICAFCALPTRRLRYTWYRCRPPGPAPNNF